MMKSPSNQFITELTADQSPTLRSVQSIEGVSVPESMHHSGGAAAETEYIYGEAIKLGLSIQKKLNFSVVGLGLGYIEILISSLASGQQISSYEIDPELRINFQNWINGDDEFEIYDQVCRSLKLDSEFVRHSFKNNKLILNAELNLEIIFTEKNHIICFDAFSAKTSGSLWTEGFLDYFISNACADDCIFTTYACTGLLKRALVRQGFQLIPRSGFTGKRDSTLAVRGTFKTLF
jgi:hypothetical protein